MTTLANPTQKYFLLLFEEFTCVPTGKLNAYVGIAASRLSQQVWGAQWPYATCLLAAHMLASTGMSSQGGDGGSVGGPVTEESVGDLSRSYGTVGTPGSGDQELLTTRYGQEFVALRRETIIGISLTGTSLSGNGNGSGGGPAGTIPGCGGGLW